MAKSKIARSKATKTYRIKLREKIIDLLGGKCTNPYNLNHGDFTTDSRYLQIDHVNGGGNKERIRNNHNIVLFYLSILKKIKEGSKEYQLLCANCNWIKRHVNDEMSKKDIS